MEVTDDADTLILTIPRTWDMHLARWISHILSPPLLGLAGVALIASALDTPGAWLWSAYVCTLTILLPITYILYKVRKGEIADFYMRVRAERIRPMTLMLACALTAWLSMWAFEAPRILTLFAWMGVMQFAFLLLVTLRWKISGHGTAVANLALFLTAVFGSAGAPSLLAVPLVLWSRVRLNRHDRAQTLAGAATGAAFMTLALVLVGIRLN